MYSVQDMLCGGCIEQELCLMQHLHDVLKTSMLQGQVTIRRLCFEMHIIYTTKYSGQDIIIIIPNQKQLVGVMHCQLLFVPLVPKYVHNDIN